MFDFMKECISLYKVKNGYQNYEFPKPYISLTLIPGVESIAKYNNSRECDLRAIFDSYSLDYMEAYNKLNELKQSLLDKDYEVLKGKGYIVDRITVDPIKDLTFTQNLEKTFRYQWSVRVTYRKVV